MDMAKDMKKLSEEIISSFKERVKDNEELVSDVQSTLEEFRKEHQRMAEIVIANAAALRIDLDAGEKDRINQYHDMMKSIQKEVADYKSATIELIKEFSEARKEMSENLNKSFLNSNKSRNENEELRLLDYEVFIDEINSEVSSVIDYTDKLLVRFGEERKSMSENLSETLRNNEKARFKYMGTLIRDIQKRLSDISKENIEASKKLKIDIKSGEIDRVKEYDHLYKRIKSEVSEIKENTARLLDEYSKDRSQAAEYWDNMRKNISDLKEAKTHTPISQQEEKEEIKFGKVVDKIKELPLHEELIPVEKIVIHEKNNDATLEDKILDYINSHVAGVKVSDMEEPLHETRMKIGFAAKCLLEAGKVSKVDNLYYPLMR